MRLPTDDTVTRLFDRLRRHARHRAPTDQATVATIAELEAALLAALRRARSGWGPLDSTGAPSSEVAASRLGATRSASVLLVPDEFGWPDAVPATAVEIAAITAAEAGEVRVELDEDVEAAFVHLLEAVNHIGALQTRLHLIAKKASPLSRSESGGAGTCIACGEPVTGAASDRLKRGLGPDCYKAWQRAGKPDIAVFASTRGQQAS